MTVIARTEEKSRVVGKAMAAVWWVTLRRCEQAKGNSCLPLSLGEEWRILVTKEGTEKYWLVDTARIIGMRERDGYVQGVPAKKWEVSIEGT